jgi:protein SCO1/2
MALGRSIVAAAAGWLAVAAPCAHAEEALPAELQGVTVEEHLGRAIPGELTFRDSTGATVRFADLVDDGIPVLLTLNYYSCTTLCGVQLNALLSALRPFDWVPGEKYRIVTVSIDPSESPELAAGKRKNYLDSLGKGDVDWQFLVGDAATVAALADTVGFRYRYDDASKQFAHPAVLTFLAPGGTVARYVYGLEYTDRDLRFALMEAAAGRLGSPVDKLILSCFHYNESTGRYTPFAFGIMRLGGIVSLFAVGLLGAAMWRVERKPRIPGSDT